MSVGAVIAIGGLVGLVFGVAVSLITDIPLAPEVGLAVGALVGWLWRRNPAEPR
jgi:ribose/xylose/arabinose/galactoside ABC-type transport system permease subunit